MKSAPASLSLLLSFLVATSGGETVIEGHVALPKTHYSPVVSKRYQIVTQAGVMATDPPVAVVYLEGLPPQASPAKAQMAQKDLAFVTPLLAVQVGTTVEFPNLDDTYHNIFSYSKPKRFDLGRYRSDERPIPSQKFDQPGLVALHCDIHEHMRGIILVLPTGCFTTTDTEGRYRLAGMPAGHYVAKAWIDSKTTVEKPVDVKSGGVLHLDFP